MSHDQLYPYQMSFEATFRDLDVLGHVNHAVYFTYMETARTRFFVDLLDLKGPAELPVILAEATCRYHAPIFFGERLIVSLAISRFGGKSFDILYRLEAADGRLVATGKTVMVMYDYTNGRTISIPEEFRAHVQAFQGDWTPSDNP